MYITPRIKDHSFIFTGYHSHCVKGLASIESAPMTYTYVHQTSYIKCVFFVESLQNGSTLCSYYMCVRTDWPLTIGCNAHYPNVLNVMKLLHHVINARV